MTRRFLAATMMMLVLGAAAGASAQTAVNVTATVGASCIPIADGSFFFDIADASVATPATAIVLPTIQCTNAAVATISYVSANSPGPEQPCATGTGAAGMMNQAAPGSDQFSFGFSCGTGSITGQGIDPTDRTLDVGIPVNGIVGIGEASAASPGTYTDTITLTFAL